MPAEHIVPVEDSREEFHNLQLQRPQRPLEQLLLRKAVDPGKAEEQKR